VWFLVGCTGVAYLLRQGGSLTPVRVLALVALVAAVGAQSDWFNRETQVRHWSPYYVVNHDIAAGTISVNTIAHQTMVPFSSAGSFYSLIHLLQQHSGAARLARSWLSARGRGMMSPTR
jgi:hypothetical protein